MSASMPAANDPVALLNKIFEALVDKQISVEEAVKRAQDPTLIEALADQSLQEIASLISESSAHDWRSAQKGIQVLLAILDAKPNRALTLQKSLTFAQIGVADRACADVPDGRVFYPAAERAEKLVEQAEKAGDREVARLTLFALGTLYLDPYLPLAASANYEEMERRWHERLDDEYGNKLAGVPAEQLNVPPAKEAAKKACSYMELALAYSRGPARAPVLKALIQAHFLSESFGETIDHDQLTRWLDEALSLTDPAKFAALYADLQMFGRRLDKAGSGTAVEEQSNKLLRESLQVTVNQHGIGDTLQLYMAQTGYELNHRNNVALQLWRKLDPLIRSLRSDGERMNYLTLGLKVLTSDFTGPAPASSDQIIAASNQVISQWKQGQTDDETAGKQLVALANFTPQFNAEIAGIQMMELIENACPDWFAEFAEILTFFMARLQEWSGTNAYQSQQFTSAAEQYMRAASTYCKLALGPPALLMLEYTRDAVLDGDNATLLQAIASVSIYINTVQATTGSAGLAGFHKLFDAMLVAFYKEGNQNGGVLLALLGLMKGASLSALLEQPPSWRYTDDQQALSLLRNVADAQSHLIASNQWTSNGVLDPNELLLTYAAPEALAAGSNELEVFENTQHIFDSYLNSRLLAETADRKPSLVALETIRKVIGDRTVLVIQLLGPDTKGKAALHTMMIANDKIAMVHAEEGLAAGTAVLTDKDGKFVEADYLALSIGELRRQVIDDNTDVAGRLQADTLHYLGPDSLKLLSEWRAEGKDHLCISPHGPMHYYPFHLMSSMPDTFIGADWKVTYAPSLGMLMRSPLSPAAAAKAGLRSFGVNWKQDNALKLPALENAAEEASVVASQFGTKAETNSEATKAVFLEALASAKYVHVATHGIHNVPAPAFQCICLSPSDTDDGVLRSYELAGMDLRGCELITLSACETALGRFDRLDNLRGLPATLFTAGVRTIVGTLWPIESHCAQYFFSVLYQRLQGGDSKLDAFAAAQSSTRQFYPQLRDWGAFYFAGEW